MKFYPLNLDVEEKSCVIVGGGEVALRKIQGLLAAGAVVKVIAPEVSAGVEELFQRGEISLMRENFSEELLGDEVILIAATNNPEVNRQVSEVARSKKILVNVVDGGGNFNVPSTIRRGELLLTISTGANSPAFAKFVREMLELELGENFGAGLEIISAWRLKVKKILPNPQARKIFWRKILTQETWQLLKHGQLNELEDKINHALESFGIESQDGSR